MKTLEQYLVDNGFMEGGHTNKCCCPFHGDRNPSAYFNPNHIYCFVCQRSYSLKDFYQRFGVRLQRVEQPSNELKALHGEKVGHYGEVLFQYNWED